MKRLIYFLSAVLTLGGCRLDKTNELQDAQAALEGDYGYQKQKQFATVWDSLHISPLETPGAGFSVVQTTVVERHRDGKTLPRQREVRKMTASFDPETGELYLKQRGKTYRVDLKARTIADQVDTFYRKGR